MSGTHPTHSPPPNAADASLPAEGGAEGATRDQRFEQIRDAGRREALARLLGQGRQAGENQVRHFEQAVQELGLSLQWLWGERDRDGSYRSVILIAPQAGGTGMVFLSRPRGVREIEPHAALAHYACRHVSTDQVGMAQALLALDQELERSALERGGFEKLAVLTYMQRRIGPADAKAHPQDIDWPPGTQLLTYTEQRRPLFLAALEASYEQTLDCPALYGRRRLEDVLRGHMATGEFDPDLWTLLMVDDAPAGVMLLNRVPTAGCTELVYLGLGLAYRGGGFATRLLEHAVRLSARLGEDCLSLAVDEGNHPARRLYERFSFRRTTRKLALVRHLRDQPLGKQQ